jgi:hypothetical protein
VSSTFRSCSKQFYQIYTIHIDIGSTNEENNVIPMIYILLPNKTKMVYEYLNLMVKTHFPNFNPESFTLTIYMIDNYRIIMILVIKR